MTQRYTYPKHCFTCGESKKKQELCISVDNFQTFCNDNAQCTKGQKNLVMLDVKTIQAELKKIYPESFAKDLIHRLLSNAMSFRPDTAMMYYILQVAKKERLYSYNEAVKHILGEYMRQNPSNLNIADNPINSTARNSHSELTNNPFALPNSEATIVDATPVKAEPKKPKQPEQPEPPKEEQEEEELFTL